jgi:hypothetical protein
MSEMSGIPGKSISRNLPPIDTEAMVWGSAAGKGGKGYYPQHASAVGDAYKLAVSPQHVFMTGNATLSGVGHLALS